MFNTIHFQIPVLVLKPLAWLHLYLFFMNITFKSLTESTNKEINWDYNKKTRREKRFSLFKIVKFWNYVCIENSLYTIKLVILVHFIK